MSKLFGRKWARAMVDGWNTRPELHPNMAGAGAVAFHANEKDEIRTVILNWDSRGMMSWIKKPKNPVTKSFTSTTKEWGRFFGGEYSAVIGVMSGKIKFKGPMSFAVQYGRKFDCMRELARSISG